ncbi:MAG: hypothetical protein R2784_05110 [Saprospiraceae bacterium]
MTLDAIHEEGAKYSTTLQKYSYLDIPKSSSEVIYYRLRQQIRWYRNRVADLGIN